MLSLDQEVTLRHPPITEREFSPVRNPMIRRKLPPVPPQGRKPPSPGANQDSLNTVGDRRSLPTSIEQHVSQKKADAFIKSRRHFSCADGEKLDKTEETGAKQKEEATNKIVVTGFKESSSLESLGFFFENKRKSGGDDIVTSKLIKDPDAFIIEFRDGSGRLLGFVCFWVNNNWKVLHPESEYTIILMFESVRKRIACSFPLTHPLLTD